MSKTADPGPGPSTSATGATAAVVGAACLSADTLLNLLECPVCLEFCDPPIYACIIGHKICKGCAPNIHRCPVCRSGYTGTRDFVAEDLYAKLFEAGLVPGANEQVDDDKELPICHLGTLSESLKIQCSLGELTNLPNFECYVAHLVHRHKVAREELQIDATFKKRYYYRKLSFVRNGASKLLVLACSGHSFLLMLNKTDDKIWIYVTVASNKIANEFMVDLEIPLASVAGGEGVLVNNTKRDVHCIKENPGNIYRQGTCLMVKESTLNELGCHRIAKFGRAWELKVTIRRKLSLAGKKPPPIASVGAVRSSPQRNAALIAELPHFDDDDGDDLGDQILGLQNQVRDFRIGLMNRIHSAGRIEGTGTTAGGASDRRGISQLSPEEPPADDGSIRNRTLLYRSAGTSNLSADSSESEPRNSLTIRERSLGRLREHRDMVMELRRLREQREALDRLDRREREGRTFPRMERRALRRTQPSIITSRDFFTDSDEENDYIERLAREAHARQETNNETPESGASPFRPLRNPRRATSATTATATSPSRPSESSLFEPADPARLRYFLAQQRRATSPDTTSAAPRYRDSSAADTGCVIS